MTFEKCDDCNRITYVRFAFITEGVNLRLCYDCLQARSPPLIKRTKGEG